MEAIFEIKLRAKEPINGYKKGDTSVPPFILPDCQP